MQQLHTDIVQSFWLRFWREPHQGPRRQWRGTIWHEQLSERDKPIAIANPDEAFEFIRQALYAPDEIAAADGDAAEQRPPHLLRRIVSKLTARRYSNRERGP